MQQWPGSLWGFWTRFCQLLVLIVSFSSLFSWPLPSQSYHTQSSTFIHLSFFWCKESAGQFTEEERWRWKKYFREKNNSMNQQIQTICLYLVSKYSIIHYQYLHIYLLCACSTSIFQKANFTLFTPPNLSPYSETYPAVTVKRTNDALLYSQHCTSAFFIRPLYGFKRLETTQKQLPPE